MVRGARDGHKRGQRVRREGAAGAEGVVLPANRAWWGGKVEGPGAPRRTQHENGESGERESRAPRGSMHEGESLPAAAESLRTMHAYAKKLIFGKILQKTEVSPAVQCPCCRGAVVTPFRFKKRDDSNGTGSCH